MSQDFPSPFVTRQRYFEKPFFFFIFRINQQNYKNKNIHLESENSSNEEDILSVNCRTLKVTSTRDNIDDLVFRNPSIINPNQASSTTSQVPTELSKKFSNSNDFNAHNKKLSKINTCKGLQRKLEQKVERAKKKFLQNEKVNQLENDIIVSFDRGYIKCRLCKATTKKFQHDEGENLSNYCETFFFCKIVCLCARRDKFLIDFDNFSLFSQGHEKAFDKSNSNQSTAIST